MTNLHWEDHSYIATGRGKNSKREKSGYSSWIKEVFKDQRINDLILLKQNEKWKDCMINMWKRLQKETHPFILCNDQDSEGATNLKDLKNTIVKSMPKQFGERILRSHRETCRGIQHISSSSSQWKLQTVVLWVWTMVCSWLRCLSTVSFLHLVARTLSAHSSYILHGDVAWNLGGFFMIFMVLGNVSVVFACFEAPSRLWRASNRWCSGTGQGINDTMTSVPLWASAALQSAASRWELSISKATGTYV